MDALLTLNPLAFAGGLHPAEIVSIIVLLAFSVSVHEAAHGYVAWKCGDSTARDMGRITVNPIPHIDPFMTIALPLLLLIGTQGRMVFGGAKPVPVLFHRLRHPWRDMSLVALAGPASNFLLAVLFLVVWRLFVEFGGYSPQELLPRVFETAVELNLLLAAFNLIPIPPLDGSRVMAWILPDSVRPAYVRLEAFGMLIVIALLYSGILRGVIVPIMGVLYDVVVFIATAGGLW